MSQNDAQSLHLPHTSNGSPAAGSVPDQSDAPAGFFVVRTDHGPTYIRASAVTGLGPGVVVDQNTRRAEVLPGRCNITLKNTGTMQANHTQSTIAKLVSQAMKADPQTLALHSQVRLVEVTADHAAHTREASKRADEALREALAQNTLK